jgi:hypothetical protein
MIKKLLDWITGKSDKVAEAPVAPVATVDMSVGTEAVVVVKEEVAPVVAIETAPVTVKAKYKKAELNKMTKAQLLELVEKHSLEVKSRSTKEELVTVLAKV